MIFKQIKIVLLCIIIACLIHSFSNVIGIMDIDYKVRHISPYGKEVLVTYDFVGRPTVFYNNNEVWSYQGSGFNESLPFSIIWITANEILITQEQLNIKETIFIP